MDHLKVSLDSDNQREGLITTKPKPPHEVCSYEQPRVPNNFYTSMWYMLQDTGYNHSINTYFDIYTQYKPLEKRGDTEVNLIWGIIKPKGVGTVVLGL